MTQTKKEKETSKELAEELMNELGKAKSIDDFYGKEGIFSRVFSKTIEQMLETGLSDELGYNRYDQMGEIVEIREMGVINEK
jgi:hypothetical protein